MDLFQDKANGVFDVIFDAVSEGIIVIDQDQRIVKTNVAASRMFGYPNTELYGQSLDVLIPKKFRAHHSSRVKGFVQEQKARQMGQGRDLYGARKDGTEFPVEAGLNPFKLEGRQYVLAVLIDITIRKQQQEQIIELNEQLEQRIQERTSELHDTVKELKAEVLKRLEIESQIKESLQKERELNELKTKFLSLVSHEFKTPLSGILTSATLAGKYTKTEQQEKRDKHLKIIRAKVKYLTNILNDFLSIERLETGKVSYTYSVFPLSKVINEVTYDANMLLKEGQHILYPDGIDHMVLNFDEKILELTLTNLLNNAIKYSGENTDITIDVVSANKRLQISVSDQGMGIPLTEQKHIFNRYFRAENALLTQGTGIGLNIVKNHLENLGGTITFISREAEGSTFTIDIPLEENLSNE